MRECTVTIEQQDQRQYKGGVIQKDGTRGSCGSDAGTVQQECDSKLRHRNETRHCSCSAVWSKQPTTVVHCIKCTVRAGR